jgi:hypothetical protein
MNFHEIVREVVDGIRLRFPLVNVELEHRGDGEGEWDRPALEAEVDRIVAEACAIAGAAGRVWLRTDCKADDEVLLRLELSGAEITSDADLRGRAAAIGYDLGPRVALRLPRSA